MPNDPLTSTSQSNARNTNIVYRLEQVPYLRYSLLFYLLLGGLDTIHHLHAALALGHMNGMHAFLLGIVLIPSAVGAVVFFAYSKNEFSLWLFLSISILAIAVPGFYHGGWEHLTKLLAYLRVEGESTDIRSLFPMNNRHLWFYEISGSLEFVLALVSSLFTYKLLVSVVADKIPFYPDTPSEHR